MLASASSIESFYESATHIYDLINWHTVRDDSGPLAYVVALQIARAHNVRTCLDFGSGVGVRRAVILPGKYRYDAGRHFLNAS
jgi:hypothetical protein